MAQEDHEGMGWLERWYGGQSFHLFPSIQDGETHTHVCVCVSRRKKIVPHPSHCSDHHHLHPDVGQKQAHIQGKLFNLVLANPSYLNR